MNKDKEFMKFLSNCIDGDQDSRNAFVDKYNNLLTNYVIRTLKRYNYPPYINEIYEQSETRTDAVDAFECVDDIVSRVYLSLFDQNCRRLRNFRGQNERSFGAYLREVSFHYTVDYLRGLENFFEVVELDEILDRLSPDNPYEIIGKKELTKCISKIKKELPDRHKFLFKLTYEEGFDLSEISEILDLNIKAVHQLKFRMINNLIKIAKKQEVYDGLKDFINYR